MKQSPTVLIVEDEAVMAMLLEKRIKSRGFSVCGVASTKEQAVDLSLKFSPDFIIMDIRLSGEDDGIEAAEEITSKVKTRIIFSTGYSNEKVISKAMKLDPLAYLVKPFDILELIAIMNRNREMSD